MYHHAAESIVVCSGANELDLATTALFCRCSHGNHTAVDAVLLDGHCSANHGGQTSRRDEIVATGMSDGVECVIPMQVSHAERQNTQSFLLRIQVPIVATYSRLTTTALPVFGPYEALKAVSRP